jgi:hypothetical protein
VTLSFLVSRPTACQRLEPSSPSRAVSAAINTSSVVGKTAGKSASADFGGKPGAWAYAESPLVDGDRLVCTPGGGQATLVALNKKTGDVLWKCKDEITRLRAIVCEGFEANNYVE